jgi:uncharacterized protein (DUF1778 family)
MEWEDNMAAQLSEEGRFPAVQEISEAEYTRFVHTCQNAPEPTEKLKALLAPSKAKDTWR